MKFSVIVTTFNEAGSIVALLDSLAKQTLQPSEVVIVDAGSTDGTVDLISNWQLATRKFEVVVEVRSEVNRSRGRNLAIQMAKEEWIAVTDAGCVVDEGWLEELGLRVEGRGSRVNVVAGAYVTRPKSAMEQVFSWYLAVQPDEIDEETFLPSSRSIAFTKAAWEGVGKYPEELDTCEDLVFAQRLKKTYGLVVAKKAIVYWSLPQSLGDYFARVAGYARGDAQARYQPHVRKIGLVFARYLVFLVWPKLWLLYLVVWPVGKFGRKLREVSKVSEVSEVREVLEVRKVREVSGALGLESHLGGGVILQLLLLLPVVQVVSDLAVMWGVVRGLVMKRS